MNSSLPCVLVDVVRFKMGKFSCCVPGCTNNWRNSPEKKFHTLPSDAKVRRSYEKLIRNENLKLNAHHTRICGDHFPDGERMCRTQLPSIFPWTATPKKRRVIEKHEVPSTTKKIRKGLEACELRSEDVFAEEIENNCRLSTSICDCNQCGEHKIFLLENHRQEIQHCMLGSLLESGQVSSAFSARSLLHQGQPNCSITHY